MKKNRGEGAGRRRLVWPVWEEEEYEREFMEISSRLEGAGVPANWADNAALQLVKLNRAFDRGELGEGGGRLNHGEHGGKATEGAKKDLSKTT